MPEPPRFYTDANIAHAVVYALRARGVDIVSAVEAGLRTADDDEHLGLAHAQARVLVTLDRDFVRLHRNEVEHSGIVFFAAARSIGEMVESLLITWFASSAEEMKGRLEYF